MKVLLFVLLFAFSTVAQSELPDKGLIAEIEGKTKYYLIADGFATKYMLPELKKHKRFQKVDKVSEAEFFVEYKTLNVGQSTLMHVETGQLDVFYRAGEKKIIVWTDTDRGGTPMRSLTKKAFKALAPK